VELEEPEEIRVEEIIQEEEPEAGSKEIELLGISLHTLTRAISPKTMRVLGKIGVQ
jgi:hypothetical protein